MDIKDFSKRYKVRKLNAEDVAQIYALCSRNTLYYKHCPPFVSEQSILDDMKALPPKKSLLDKFYLGYFDEGKLIAVMDFIRGYPNGETAFLGFFMTDVSVQKKGVGSGIIEELCSYLPQTGLSFVRIGWVKGNAQAEHFWHKNGFVETGVSYETDGYTVIVAQKDL